jgi:beta-N-acetylhexosaminidase
MSDLESYRRKAAGLLVVRLGNNMPPPRRAEEDAAGIAHLLQRYPIAGLILFNGRWPETRQTLARLQSLAERPLLVMTDMERGLGQQAHGATLFPHQRAFGEIGDEGLVDAFARASAREALACGVHVALGPVADVNRNPQNPIISTRAFGEKTELVSRLVAAYVRGARAEGLLTTAKHFPGHGNTAEDSHAVLPTVHDSREEIEREDLPPFRAAFDAGAELVMTAHIRYPELDATGRPATLSRAMITDLLRGELGFEGAVISDSLQMEGIKEGGKTEAELAVEQVQAGMDLLLDPEDAEALIEGLALAMAEGRLSEDRVDEALARAQSLRNHFDDRFGARIWTDPSASYPPSMVASREHKDLAARAARAAVQIEGTLPFDSGEGVLAVLLRSHTTPFDPPEQALGQALREACPGIDYLEVGPQSSETVREVVRDAAGNARAVLLALVVKPAAWHAFGLPEELDALARDLASHEHVVVASLGDPIALAPYDGAAARIVTFSDTPVSQKALAAAIGEALHSA